MESLVESWHIKRFLNFFWMKCVASFWAAFLLVFAFSLLICLSIFSQTFQRMLIKRVPHSLLWVVSFLRVLFYFKLNFHLLYFSLRTFSAVFLALLFLRQMNWPFVLLLISVFSILHLQRELKFLQIWRNLIV